VRHDYTNQPARTGDVGTGHAARFHKPNRLPAQAGQAPEAINKEADDLPVAQPNHECQLSSAHRIIGAQISLQRLSNKREQL